MKPDPNPAYRRFRDYRPPSTGDRIVAFAAVSLLLGALLLAVRAAFAMPFAMRLAFWGQSSASSSKLANMAYPENYVQDGLVCMYDGKWNAGWGRHDSTATTWRNIGSGGSRYDAVIASQKASAMPQWGDDYVRFPPNSPCFYINYREFLPTVIPTNWTVECVVKDEDGRYSYEYSGILGLCSKGEYATGVDYVGLSFGQYRTGASKKLHFGVAQSYDSLVLSACLSANVASDSEYEAVSYSLSCEGRQYISSDNPDMLSQLIDRTMCVYRNGEASQTFSSTKSSQRTRPLNNPGYLCIGNACSTETTVQYNYVGRIYSVRIYDRGLTDEEVAHNYVVDAARFGLPYTDPDEPAEPDPEPTEPDPETLAEDEAYVYYTPDTAFIVDLALMGTTNVTLTLKSIASATQVEWGDGTKTSVSGSSSVATHAYAETGRYVIRIGGDVASPWQISSKPALLNGLVRVLRWGDKVVSGANNVRCTDAVNLRGPMPRWGAAMRNVDYFYSGCVNLDGYIQPWTDNINSLIFAYFNCSKLKGNVPAWPNSVNNMGGTYKNCSSLTGTPPALPHMTHYANDTYNGCTGLTGDVPEWPTGGLYQIAGHYTYCTGLTGKIPKWVPMIEAVDGCYHGCTGLTGAWTTNAAELMPSHITAHSDCVLGTADVLLNLFKKSWGGNLAD